MVKGPRPDGPLECRDGLFQLDRVLPLAGGEEVQVIPSVHLHNFDIVSDGYYFLATASTLKFLNTAGQIITVAPQLPQGYVGLSVSPDKKSILFTADKPQTSELVLVENFQ